mgnify:CR=1 FL=1
MKLKTKDIFVSVLLTGPLSGRPATFVVVGKGKKMKAKDVLTKVLGSKSPSRFCVIRGEGKKDAMQQDLTDLITGLIRAAYYVQLETNGRTYSET